MILRFASGWEDSPPPGDGAGKETFLADRARSDGRPLPPSARPPPRPDLPLPLVPRPPLVLDFDLPFPFFFDFPLPLPFFGFIVLMKEETGTTTG